ncbi:MAG: thioesterase family protein, partial [Bryobacteraceae bacterium]
SAPAFVFRTRIRFIDTDASGRIHYTALFRYFESAEIEFLRSIGITYDMKRDALFPRVHVECDYLLALGHDDEIAIEVRVGRIGKTSVRFDFRTLKEGDLAAEGHVVVVCMHREKQKAVPLPDEIRRRLATAMAEEN